MSGALTVGELVGFIRADDTGMRRGLANSQLRMRGFQVDTEGRLRDLRGRFVSETRVMSMSLRDDLTGAITVANNATNQFTRDANGRLRDMRGRFVAAGNAAQQMGQQTRRALQDASRDGNRFSGILGRIVGAAGGLARVAAGAAPIAGVIGAAVPVAAGLVATLENIAPAAGVGVSALLAVQQASGVVKLAAVGMDDAITAALDPEKAKEFQEALKKLSPEARQFALAVKEAAPTLRKLQQDVQNRVFRGLAEDLERTGRVALPVVRRELLSTAGAMNAMGRGVLDAAKELAEDGTLGKAMGSASKGLKNLSGIPGVLVTALGQVAAAAGPSFERLTEAAGEGAERIGERLGKAFESGALQDAIENAIDLIGDLVDVGANVGDILGNIFEAANVSGGGLIGTLKTITGEIAEAFGSGPAQEGLSALFETVSKLASTAAPLLGQALGVLGPVLTRLGPPVQLLVEKLGEALEPVIENLGPLLETAADAVGKLLVAAAPLLPVIGELAASLLPKLEPLLESAAKIFERLTPVVEQLAKDLGPILSPVIEGLGEILAEFAEQGAQQFLDILEELKPIIPELTPVLRELGKSIGKILEELAPLLPKITMFGTQLLEELLPAIAPLIPPLANLAIVLLQLATGVLTNFVIPALEKLVGFMGMLREKLQPAVDAVQWVTEKIAGAFQWLYDLLIGHSIIPDLVNGIVALFLGLPGRAASALSSLPGAIGSIASRAASVMLSALQDGGVRAIAAVASLPGRAASALGGLGSVLAAAGRSLIDGFISGIKSRFEAVKSTLSSLTSSLPDWKGPEDTDERILTPAGRKVIQSFQRGIALQVPALESQMAGLTMGLPGMALPGQLNSGGGGGVQRVVLDVRGGDDEFLRMIRRWVDIEGGGDAQTAFGK